jgi:acyl-CoA synthetase (AMP-forming)/AMP-acid ligase II
MECPMNLSLLLEMAASAVPDRTAVVDDAGGEATYARLAALAGAGAALLQEREATALVYVGTNNLAFPAGVFAAATVGVPFVPVNYRLGDEQLLELVGRHPGAVVVHDATVATPFDPQRSLAREAFLADLATRADAGVAAEAGFVDPDSVAVVIYTSGTTAAPKGVLLRHRHLMAYVLGTVELASAGEDEAALVSVPPYHVAGLANLLSNLYAGRRIAYLERFDAARWVASAQRNGVTHAMVVPTMLARIVAHLGDEPDAAVPTLRTLSYGGARTPAPVLQRALRVLPDVGFVHAYGLTETSSTIALLGPEDHRAALESDDPLVRARLGSCGRLLPGIEIEVRGADGSPLPPGEPGLVFLRGEQVSGEYAGASAVDGGGWFATNDQGWLDPDGYLFIEGRADDTIIRGGENVAPAEVEDALLTHDAVADVAVVGPPDDEWGQVIVAVVVPTAGADVGEDELREFARARLRTSKTPDRIVFRPDLPRTDSGKLIRRAVLADVAAPSPAAAPTAPAAPQEGS